jgi:hypothetical protein
MVARSYYILTDRRDLVDLLRRKCATFKAVMTYVFAMQTEFLPILREIIAVLLRKSIQPGVAI